MAVKNLTDVYLLMRSNSARAKRSLDEDDVGDTVSLVSASGDAERGEWGGPRNRERRVLQAPLWTDNLAEIKADIARIRHHLTELKRLHDKHLNRPSLLDEQDEESRIRAAQDEIGRLLRDCQSHVAIINRWSQAKQSGWAERQLTDNVVRAVAGQLREVTELFRQSQTDYCNRIKQRNNAGAFFDQTISLDEPPTDPAIMQSDMMFVTTQDLLTAEEVAQREEEIQAVVRSINELNVVFKEVARLVVEQGSVVDRIDYNVDAVQTSVSQGLQQLRQAAAAYKRGNGKLKCIVGLAGVTLFLIILLFITKLS
ncbi:syntaxin-16-like isoform X2 [Varroa jacobsoni]|uniref:t-SNARE coiled-coil homology domain-containing protein n=1 Tax=Varroa destructor TaxID=109461 RepID=A0A7M7KPY1_VARDE|nr:syntaxin-16-like isoform X2 [Varroa destructor]XP_022706837.1 syntaxin-16-like isoform X2 [Varroa jacobsoni]